DAPGSFAQRVPRVPAEPVHRHHAAPQGEHPGRGPEPGPLPGGPDDDAGGRGGAGGRRNAARGPGQDRADPERSPAHDPARPAHADRRPADPVGRPDLHSRAELGVPEPGAHRGRPVGGREPLHRSLLALREAMAGPNGEPQAHGEEDVDLQQILNLLSARRRLILAIMVLSLGAGALYAFKATPIYEATTSVRIDEEKSNLPVLDILKTLSSGSQVETEMQVLRSRTVAEAVVDTLALQVEVVSPKRVPRSRVLARVEASRATAEANYRLRREGEARFTVVDASTGQRLGTFAVGEPIALGGAILVLAPGAVLHDEILIRVRTFEEAVERLRKAVRVTRPVRDATIVEVEFRGGGPELVRGLPNVIAGRCVAEREEVRR